MKYKVKYKFWLKNGTYLEETVDYANIKDAANELKEHEDHIWEVIANNRVGRLGVGRLHIITSEIVAYAYEDVSEPDIFASEEEEVSEIDGLLKKAWEEV